jgi:hypothetical protein
MLEKHPQSTYHAPVMPPDSPYRGRSKVMPSAPPRGRVFWLACTVAALALIVVRGLWVAGLRNGHDLSTLAWMVPVVALGVTGWIALWACPRWVFLMLRHRRDEARALSLYAAMGLGFVAVTAVVEREVQRRVDARMESVVAAMTRFREERGHFPVHVEDVVPQYLSSIPTPWPLNAGCGFNYIRTGERVMLLREALDDDGDRPCAPQHGLRYRFLRQRWETW